MKASFEVRGTTAAEMRDAAKKILEVLDPDEQWVVHIDARPVAMTATGEVAAWTAEVSAHTH